MVDNGGPEYEESKPYEPDAWLDEIDEIERKSGLSLDAVISRFLPPEFHGHKQKALELITARGGKKGDLHLLTKDEFLEYNAADAENTLRLYTVLTGILAERQIDWKLDHRLYLSTSRLCSQSKTRGILVDFKALNAHVEAKKTALCKISADFISAHQDAIVKVEEALLERALSRVKTDTAKDKIRADPPRFNTKSTDQLAMLFVDVLGMKPKFKTAKGKPAFGRKLLGQWGSGGLILAKQRTELIELKQGESLLELGGYDGRYHVDIKCAGTRTGRLSGGEQA
jgi:DNA polymerase I-like protein with 3'-5' exonuclease and polymerase domains